MPESRIILGNIFVLRPVLQIFGEVSEVVVQKCENPPDSCFPRIFPKNFYLFKIIEPQNKDKRCRDRITAVLLDNNEIPEASITGENSVIGENIVIESNRAIAVKKTESRVPGKPGHRLFVGTFLVLQPFTEIVGLVINVVTKENRQNPHPTSPLFNEGFYFMHIVEEKEDKGLLVRQEISVIVDGNTIPPKSITDDSSIVDKIVDLKPDRIIVTDLTI